MPSDRKDTSDALRAALEQTVPATHFSPESMRELAEQTAVDATPMDTAERFLRKTVTDESSGASTTDTITRFGDTSEVPVQLSQEGESGGPRFALVDKLGSGATSHVYAVRDNSLERTVAVKFLKGSRGRSQKSRSRFLHEARVTAQLEHPNIMPIHDIGLDADNRLFFVMKSVDGRTVGTAIRQSRNEPVDGFSSIEDKLEILYKLCDAVAFAHNHGYIHQDIKPDNIMLGEYGEVLLLDWGCALHKHMAVDDTGKAIYGTPAYMSPEQARREHSDERSDIYCIGSTLFHMLTLHHPTWSDSPETFWEMKTRGELSPLPAGAAEQVPGPLLDICRKTMAPEAGDRYQSIAELRQAVREYQAHAESITLTQQARDRLMSATDTGDYDQFAEIIHDLHQALRMWPENQDAAEAELLTRESYATCALDRADLQLAETIIGDNPRFGEVRTRLERLRAARQARRKRTRILQAAAGVLGFAVAGFLVYLGVDYFRYFGSWRTVYHWNPSLGQPRGIERTVSNRDFVTGAPDSVLFDGTAIELKVSHTYWLDGVRVAGDVRVEVLALWPKQVDGLEINMQARREMPPEWWMAPRGYTAQFGANRGLRNIISRNNTGRRPSGANGVAAELEPGHWYRLAFEHRGDEVAIYVDGRRVYRQVELLPFAGTGYEHIALRCWDDARIRSITVKRLALPRKASPLVVGDAAVVKADYDDALRQYLQLAEDFQDIRVGERALAKAYLVLNLMDEGTDSLRREIHELLRQRFPSSEYWPVLTQYDCLAAWKRGDYERALALIPGVFEQDPDTRLAMQILELFDGDLWPADATASLLSWVGRTTHVASLDLSNMGLRTLEPLRGLELRHLSFDDGHVTSLEPLTGMPLQSLVANLNGISDLSPLEGMPLERLDLGGNDIEDISPLEGMPLSVLYLSANRISDLSPLAGMALVDLDIGDNDVRDIEPLRGMSLRGLGAHHNPLSSIEPLADQPLDRLSIERTGVSDLSPLAGSPLRSLIATETPIRSIEALATCTSLDGVSIGGDSLVSLEPLRGLPELRHVELEKTSVTDLSPLADAPLAILSVTGSPVRSLEPLQGMVQEELRMRDTEVTDLSPLDLSRAWSLDLGGSRIRDLRFRRESTGVTLDIRRTGITDLSALIDNAPKRLLVDVHEVGLDEIERVIRHWRTGGDTTVAYALEVQLAIATGDQGRAKRLALSFEGHRYLPIAFDMTWEEADSICTALGAHMFTVTSVAESHFTRQVQRRLSESNMWLAFEESARPTRWLTGEPITFRNFQQVASSTTPVRWYQLESNAVGWYNTRSPHVLAGTFAEWDD